MKDNRHENMDHSDIENLKMSSGTKRMVKIQDVIEGQKFRVPGTQGIWDKSGGGYRMANMQQNVWGIWPQDSEVYLVDDEVQQTLDDVKVTQRCIEEELAEQARSILEKAGYDTDELIYLDTSKGLSNDTQTGKWTEGTNLESYQRNYTVPQSNKEIVNELKVYAQRDKQKTDAEIVNAQIYSTLEEMMYDMNQLQEYKYLAAENMLDNIIEKLQNTIDNGKFIADGTRE